MFIADRVQKIRDREGYEIKTGMIEKLDEMLTAYGVEHFFSLPDGDGSGVAVDQDEVVYVYYEEKDRMTFALVYMLWAKTVRGADDDKIKKAMAYYLAE